MRSKQGFHPRMRVRSGADFQRAYRSGSRARGSLLLVVVAENGLGHTRLGLSVGRRIWRRAVKRNRLRRLFREAFRLCYTNLPEGVDLILIPAEPALEPDLGTLERELVRLARKAHGRFLEKKAAAGEESG